MAIGGIVLFHGAGGNRDHQLFTAIEDGSDVPVARVNFAYRIKAATKRRPPDRMPKLLLDVTAAADKYSNEWGVPASSIVFGGRSMGGRVCSVAVAEGMEAAGLLLLSYPLHPPGKPDKLRVDHFGGIDCPVLLVQGRRDPFGSEEEFSQHLPAIPSPVTQFWVDGNHDPKLALTPEIVAQTNEWVSQL